MYLQKGYALSLYDELNHHISMQVLKQYLTRHGWKLCYYGESTPRRNCPCQDTPDNKIGEQIIQVAGIEDYARSVSSFTYQSNVNRAVFINSAKKPSPSKMIRLLLHEIGHIINGHEAIDCILGKGNYYLEKEANYFMHCMLQLQRQQSVKDIISFHKVKFALISTLLITLCFSSGFRLMQRFSSADFSTANTIFQETPTNTPASIPKAAEDSSNPPQNSPSPSSNNAIQLDSATMVYIAKTGRVFHLYANCSYIKGHDGVTELPYAYVGEKPLCSSCKRKYLEQRMP